MRSVRYVCLGLFLAASAAAQADGGTVRVRVLSQAAPSDLRVEPIASDARVSLDGVDMGRLGVGTAATLRRDGGAVRVRFGGRDHSGQTVQIEGEGLRLRTGSVDRPYPGGLSVQTVGGSLEIVNHAPIEPYVASVVQSEFGFDELEGAKAQAVLARTYALRRVGAHDTYDLDDDQSAQVYRGSGVITATSMRAALETRGEVLTYHGALADAYYYSSSGGHTADNDAVWRGAPVPYLRAVPDPYDSASPDHTWRTSASRSQVLSALRSRYGGAIEGVEITRRSRSNRVLTIRLIGGRTETITGPQFRQAVNAVAGARTVRSTRFEITVEGDRYVFQGSGYGHGVGMSQYGALGQARAGRSYRDILTHYFQGTEVQPGSPIAAPPGLLASGAAPPTGTPSASIPREPSALRTRYRPASGRRWPTPRRTAHAPDRPALEPAPPSRDVAPPSRREPAADVARADADEVTPPRRRAW